LVEYAVQFFLEWLAVSSRVWRTNIIYIWMKTFSTYKLKYILRPIRPPRSSLSMIYICRRVKEKLLYALNFFLKFSDRTEHQRPSRRVNKKKKLCKEHLSIWYACTLWWCLSVCLSVCSLFDQFLYSSDFSFFPALNIRLVEKPGVYLVTFAFPLLNTFQEPSCYRPCIVSSTRKDSEGQSKTNTYYWSSSLVTTHKHVGMYLFVKL